MKIESVKKSIEKPLRKAWRLASAPEMLSALTLAAIVLQFVSEVEKLRKSRRKVGFRK